jgi:hypothetical protein
VAAIGRSPAIDPGQQPLKMHEKEGGIAEGPQAQILATRNLILIRGRELSEGDVDADNQVAVGIDGGRGRSRTIVKTSRVDGNRKRKQ